MRTLLTFIALLAAGVAQAHPSLIPHQHPHGPSLLPDLGSFLVGAIFLVACCMVAFVLFRKIP